MTDANVKRLYNHYVEIGMADKAKEMQEAYAKKRPPTILGEPVIPEVKPNGKKPKGRTK